MVWVRLVDYKPRDVGVLVAFALQTLGREVDSVTVAEKGKWLRLIVHNGYTSVLEHAVYTFEAVCSRVCTHQLVRHRIASYTQQSMRRSKAFLDKMVEALAKTLGMKYDGDTRHALMVVREAMVKAEADFSSIATAVEIAFAVPPSVKREFQNYYSYIQSLLQSVEKYYMLLARGVPPEDARYVLPDSVKTRITFTMNARELLEVFLPLRMCARAQWEIRQLAWKTWEAVYRVHPEIFAYAGPRCVLLDMRARKTPCTLQDYLERRCAPVIERCPEGVSREGILPCMILASTY